jgi:hypothetical protein
MDQQTYLIVFENGSAADANRWASELREFILDATSAADVEQKRDTRYSQDLGTLLSIVLGAPAVIVVAKAVGNWLTLHRQTSITIKTPQGEIVGKNLTSKDALKLAELLLAAHNKE